MEPSTSRSATVEEYDEPKNDSHGGGPSHQGGDVNGVSPTISQDYQPQSHPCESRDLLQPGPTEIQPVMRYPDRLHPSHDDMEPTPNQLPTVPTPPTSIREKRPKIKTSSSSTRRRNKDRPEYYGISGARGPVTSIPSSGRMPTIPADLGPPPRSSNARMARRPTTGWYVSGSGHANPADPPLGGGIDANPPPPYRTHAGPNETTPSPQDVPAHTNSFRSSDGMKLQSQQPHQYRQYSHDGVRNTAGMNNPGPETYPPNVGVPHYSPPQPSSHGDIVPNKGYGNPRGDLDTQAGRESREGYSQLPHPSHQQPPQAQHNPHGIIMLSSNESQPASPADEWPHQPRFQRAPSNSHERRTPPHPAKHWPASHPDARVAVHQTLERQSARPAHSHPVQSRTGYGGGREPPPPRDAPSRAAQNPLPQFQRLSVQDPPPLDGRTRQAASHATTGQFRSQGGTFQSGHLHPGTINSYNSHNAHQFLQPPQNMQWEQDPAGNEASRYTPHPQQSYSYSNDQYRPAQSRPHMAMPGDWPESPRQQAPPAASHTPQPPLVYRPVHEGSGQQVPPHSTTQAAYPAKSRRYEAPQDAYHPREAYRGTEEDPEPTSATSDPPWTNKHPGDTPSLPDGHPFLRIKDIALAAMLKDFREWQNSGMPGRRGPHGPKPPFACPFAKNDPLRHRDCFSETLPGISDVKEHVSRCHAIPIYCPRCMALFDDERARDSHIRHAGCRAARQWACPDGITESQKRQLSSDVPADLPAPDQWFRIFSIIFHGQQQQQQQQRPPPAPESPYVDDGLVDVATYRDFLESRGPHVLSETLTFRGAVTWNLPNEERDLAAFRRIILDDGIRDLVDQWAAASRTRTRTHTPPRTRRVSHRSTTSSGVDPQRTPSMGSFASSSDGHQVGAYPPSSPVGPPHRWDLAPRILSEDGRDDAPGNGVGRGEHGDFGEVPRNKMDAYPDERHGPAAYYG